LFTTQVIIPSGEKTKYIEIVASNAALTLDGDKLALLKTKADEGMLYTLNCRKASSCERSQWAS